MEPLIPDARPELSTTAVENSVDEVREDRPSADSAGKFGR
jgi:hypothetical protein